MSNSINGDGVTANDVANNEASQSGRGFSSIVSGLITNRSITALSAAAALALAGASAAQIGGYSGTNYATTGAVSNTQASSCAALNIATTNDPDINAYVDGKLVENAEYDKALSNFSTVYNTSGGATTVSTAISTIQPPGATTWAVYTQYGWDSVGGNSFNTSTNIKQAGANGWNIAVSMNGNALTVRVTNAQGQVISSALPVGGTLTLPDGSQMTASTSGSLTISQALNQGGFLTTNVNDTQADWNNGAKSNYLSVGQVATGAAVINGSAVSLLMNSAGDTPILALPCTAAPTGGSAIANGNTGTGANGNNGIPVPINNSTGQSGNSSTGQTGNSGGGQPLYTPPPAWDVGQGNQASEWE